MKTIGIFIGAKSPNNVRFTEAAIHLAHELVRRRCNIVYGGANIGLMGTLANAALELNGNVTGVIPSNVFSEEIAHEKLTKLHRVKSMHERKSLLAELSDGFIIFPGGLGTLEELFEIWNARKINLHQKPIGILNIDHYYDPLISFMKTAVSQGFLKQAHLDCVIFSDDISNLLDRMEE